MSKYKKYIAVTVGVALVAILAGTPRVIRQFTNVGIDSTAWFDSLGHNTPYTAQHGKGYLYLGGNDTLYFVYPNGDKHNIDSAGAGGGTVSHTPVIKWRTLSTVPDSQYVIRLPAAATLDSIYAFQLGASAMTGQAYRNRGGTVVALLSGVYTLTTTNTKATTLQNNALLLNDEIWVSIQTVTGTTTQINWTFFLHGSQ